MSIAEKLTTIAENEQKVYEAGYAKGAEEKSLINPEWTNWEYFFSGNSRLELLEHIKYTDTSNGTNFEGMFHRCTQLTSVPTLDTSNGTNFRKFFYYCNKLTSVPALDTSKGTDFYQMFSDCTKLTSVPELDTSNGTNFYCMFQYCHNLTSVPELDTSNGTNFYAMFGNCNNLVTIPKLNLSKATNTNPFGSGTTKLKNITFEGTIGLSLDMRYCTLLTHDSLMSAINALYDYSTDTSGKTYTLTIGTENLAKLTDSEKAIATQRGWSLA